MLLVRLHVYRPINYLENSDADLSWLLFKEVNLFKLLLSDGYHNFLIFPPCLLKSLLPTVVKVQDCAVWGPKPLTDK